MIHYVLLSAVLVASLRRLQQPAHQSVDCATGFAKKYNYIVVLSPGSNVRVSKFRTSIVCVISHSSESV